ncbi:protein kinase [Streptomyces sp. NPDC102462]|uniref:serine/threonine-protein kinase n=1 Tax=Streptomyces sp. NPDC102462 TaxID=3366178 RepID=UPI0037F47784
MEKLGPGDPRGIGAYRLLARLGAGGMGHVYLARSERGRTVAVKLVREELAAQEEFRARFRQEVRAARRVGGHWTAPVLDADTEAAVPWVATGYVAGPSLQQVVGREHGALPERTVRILAAGLAHALQDIHAAGIVHRDLKPSNVLVTIDGPRVIDFGIARALETLAGDGLTRTGSLVGSPGFMAPEQVRGDRITPACDVFCLGSVLAYAATGTLPFGGAGSGVHALMFRIAQEEPDLAGVPEGIADLVRDCLRKDPAARPTLDRILERTGAEDTVSDGRSRDPWLPATLVAQLGRHAVSLLETENPENDTTTRTPAPAPGPGDAGDVNPAGALGVAGVRGADGAEGSDRAGVQGAGGAGASGGHPAGGGDAPARDGNTAVQTRMPFAPEPGVPGPAAPASGVPGPSAPASGVPGPGVPGPAAPASGVPGSAAPHPAASGPAVPGPATPGPATPGPGLPGSAAPGPAAPASGVPGPAAPHPAAPHPVAPGPGVPGSVGPGVAAFGFGVGGSGSPEHAAVTDGPAPSVSEGSVPAGGRLPAVAAGHTPGPGAPPHSGFGPAGVPGPYGHGHPQQHPQPAGYGYPHQPPYAGGPGPTPPYGPGTQEPERRSGRSTALLVVIALVVALAAGGSVYALLNGGGTTDDKGGGGTATSAPPTGGPTGGTPSPTDSAPADGVVPAAYLGTWETSIENAAGHNTRELTITQGKVGDTVLTLVADGPAEGGGTYHCVFEAKLAEQPSGEGPLRIGPSTVASGEPLSSCSPGEATLVTLLPDGRLRRTKPAGGENLTYTRR